MAIPSPGTKKGSKAGGSPVADTPSQFGDRLRRWRSDRGVTLRDVSEVSGISIAYLSDLERGKLANPTLDTLTALAAALGVSLNELLGIEAEQPGEPRLPAALQEFRSSIAFRDAVTNEAARWKMSPEEVERGWIESLSAIRIGRRAPRSASDYLFIFEAARRVLE
ncbi:MAG TPA: helix-turn-helix transcriptional regulator [Acidimicrobiales bacterium]|nr:helix-turn-helix transcriptional regulator [Acidimicrobiales bacterium]